VKELYRVLIKLTPSENSYKYTAAINGFRICIRIYKANGLLFIKIFSLSSPLDEVAIDG